MRNVGVQLCHVFKFSVLKRKVFNFSQKGSLIQNKTKDVISVGTWELLSLLLNNHDCWWKSSYVTQAGMNTDEVTFLKFIFKLCSVLFTHFHPHSLTVSCHWQTTKWNALLTWIEHCRRHLGKCNYTTQQNGLVNFRHFLRQKSYIFWSKSCSNKSSSTVTPTWNKFCLNGNYFRHVLCVELIDILFSYAFVTCSIFAYPTHLHPVCTLIYVWGIGFALCQVWFLPMSWQAGNRCAIYSQLISPSLSFSLSLLNFTPSPCLTHTNILTRPQCIVSRPLCEALRFCCRQDRELTYRRLRR